MKRIALILNAILSLLLPAGIALASLAYQGTVTLFNNTATNYPMLAANVTLPISTLISSGYLTADGLDARLSLGGSNIPFMLTSDKMLFAAPINNYSGITPVLTTGNTLASDFDIIAGNGGYITISDNVNLELGDNFSIEFNGWIDTTLRTLVSNNTTISSGLLSQSGLVAWDAALLVDGIINGAFDTDTSPIGSYMKIDFGTDNATWIGRWDYYASGTNVNAVWDIQRSNDAVNWETVFTGLDMDGATGWHTANWTAGNPARYWRSYKTNAASVGDAHSELVIYTGSGTYRYLINKLGALQVYIGATGNITAQIVGTSANVSAVGISSSNHTVSISANTTHLKIFVDNIEKSSVALGGASVNNTDSNWILAQNNSMPYMEYFKLGAGGAYISPTGFVDASFWEDETLAYDLDPLTFAYRQLGSAGWTGWLYFTLPSMIYSNEVKLLLGEAISGNWDQLEVDYWDGAWNTIYHGAVTVAYSEVPTTVVKTFTTDNISQVRIRGYDSVGGALLINEVYAWDTSLDLWYQPTSIISGTTLPDRIGGDNPGTFTWGGNPAGMVLLESSFLPVTQSNYSGTTLTTSQGILTDIPTAPSQLFTELNFSRVPGAEAVNLILAQGDVPQALWWFPVIFFTIGLLGFSFYALTAGSMQNSAQGAGSLLVMCIITELCFSLAGLVGPIPLWPAFLFPVPALAIILSTKHYAWG